jgi:hypothetical protein
VNNGLLSERTEEISAATQAALRDLQQGSSCHEEAEEEEQGRHQDGTRHGQGAQGAPHLGPVNSLIPSLNLSFFSSLFVSSLSSTRASSFLHFSFFVLLALFSVSHILLKVGSVATAAPLGPCEFTHSLNLSFFSSLFVSSLSYTRASFFLHFSFFVLLALFSVSHILFFLLLLYLPSTYFLIYFIFLSRMHYVQPSTYCRKQYFYSVLSIINEIALPYYSLGSWLKTLRNVRTEDFNLKSPLSPFFPDEYQDIT